MITLLNVSKIFYHKSKKSEKTIYAVNQVSLHIPKGEVTAVIGVSGAGKTSLLKLICGLLKPDCGMLRVMDVNPITKRKSIAYKIGTLFSNHTCLNESETVETNFQLIKIIYRLDSVQYEKDKERLVLLFQIQEILQEKVINLSLGQRRRVELIGLFLISAELLILDEPCIGLDAVAKQAFEHEIERQKNMGVTIMISSHNMGDIDSLCSRFILMNEGKVTYYGNKQELYRLFQPIDRMRVEYNKQIPNLQDLPVKSYTFDDNVMNLTYNTNSISAAEILRTLMKCLNIQEVNIQKPSLEQVITSATKNEEDKNESFD